MQEVNASNSSVPGPQQSLHEILRQGAQRLLTQAIEAEVAVWIEEHQHLTDAQGRRLVVRNGYLPERKIVTGLGEVPSSSRELTIAGRLRNVSGSAQNSCRLIYARPRASKN